MKILRLFLLSLFMIIICSSAINAQQLGVRSGWNFSKVTGGDLPDKDNNNGWYIGVTYEMPFIVKDLLYLVPEVQYSQQGFGNVNLDYISVPILAKIYLVKIISLELGPQFGFNIGDNAPADLNYSIKTFDPAWAAGLAINLPFRLSISGRYVGSFSEVVEGTGSKNMLFQAGLSFRFK
ncbi:outer membrane beta-barrel protein [Solitalea koreensis]|uniref:Outer membrane protein beta-barrel domain-containing protein n=1 Tax=Solitalea koreensis TaxID=543615 RepID=A0A521CH30_9SPHI|nr:outer membrane beta-barrel protein [Solitalea koreensis]SMO58767.1 Outer membrane protein beta-barrel domain-containing protein [Solitalea koreensis]